MKHLKLSFVAVLAVLFVFSACSKYEEGPAFSLLTKKARITGEWQVDEVIVNGTALTELDDYAGTMTFEKDGTGSYSNAGVTSETEWEFSDDKEAVKVKMKFLGVWTDWTETEILRLTNSEFWTTETTLGVTTEIHYTKL